MIELVFDLVDRPSRAAPVVLDPACGTGRFLLTACSRWGLLPLCMRGFDTDPAALDAAQTQLPGADLRGQGFREAEGVGDVDLMVGNPPYVRNRGNKRDLYVDFIESARTHLRPGGQLALVLSNAWLDVGYGRIVRELLLRDYAVEWIVESDGPRWFPGASIHTVVLVARRSKPGKVNFGRVAQLPGPVEVVRTVAQADLPVDAPWGPWLRAPSVWFDVRERPGMVALGELCTLQRGWTTNNNRFYYPPADSGIEPRWLRPLLKSPKRVKGVRFDPEHLPDRAFVCGMSVDELRKEGHTGAVSWIGERDEHRLRGQEPARLFVLKGVHDRFRQPLASSPVHGDQQLYLVRPKGVDVQLLAALLNGSWSHLSMEMAGRVNFGDGVLWLSLADARAKVLLPDPRLLTDELVHEIRRSFAALPDVSVPRASEAHVDPVWSGPLARLDQAIGQAMGVDDGCVEAIRLAWQQATARRLRMGRSP